VCNYKQTHTHPKLSLLGAIPTVNWVVLWTIVGGKDL
jgi:hypothetical protein